MEDSSFREHCKSVSISLVGGEGSELSRALSRFACAPGCTHARGGKSGGWVRGGE